MEPQLEAIESEEMINDLQAQQLVDELYMPAQSDVEFKEKFFLKTELNEERELAHLKAELQLANLDSYYYYVCMQILDTYEFCLTFEKMTKYSTADARVHLKHALYTIITLSNSINAKKQNLVVERKIHFQKQPMQKKDFFGREVNI